MHSSWLSYALERPYPQRWVTPVVTVGGAVFLVLFSILNYASSGFTLVVEYSSNPNTTMEQAWFGSKLPSLITNRLKAQCQSTSIPRQTEILTNNTALSYQVTSVRTADGRMLSSLVYSNNRLENCSVQSVSIELDREDRTAVQMARIPWGIDTRARITCFMPSNTPGLTTVNLTAAWNPVPNTVPASTTSFDGSYDFLGRNAQNKSSLYWGEALLMSYYSQMDSQMDGGYTDQIKAAVIFEPRGNVSDITSLDYYYIDWRMIDRRSDGSLYTYWSGEDPHTGTGMHVGIMASEPVNPNIWIAADSLAKTFQSIILTDLGQVNSAQANFLIDADQLQYFSANLSDINSTFALQSGLPMADYNSLKGTTGPLGVTPATLSTDYLCNVPQRKPWGPLLVSIIVADLVFMQVLWQLFGLVVGASMRRKSRKVDWCEGCINSDEADGIPLTSVTTKQRRASSSYEIIGLDPSYDGGRSHLL